MPIDIFLDENGEPVYRVGANAPTKKVVTSCREYWGGERWFILVVDRWKEGKDVEREADLLLQSIADVDPEAVALFIRRRIGTMTRLPNPLDAIQECITDIDNDQTRTATMTEGIW